MIRITKDKLIINIEHPAPDEFVIDMKAAIISAIQNMELAEHTDLKEFRETNVTLLELLKHLG